MWPQSAAIYTAHHSFHFQEASVIYSIFTAKWQAEIQQIGWLIDFILG